MTSHTITADTAVETSVTSGIDTDKLRERAVAVLHYSLGIAVALSALAGITRLLDTGLPGCASSRTERTLQTIARANDLAGSTISARRLVSKAPTGLDCAATVTAASGARYEMTYRIFRNEAGRVRVSAGFQPL